MNNVLRGLARLLPDEIVFGESFRYAKDILRAFNSTGDKVDFASSFRDEKLKYIFNVASNAPFYKDLNGYAKLQDIPFITKEIVLGSFNDLIVSKSSADYVTTGGTSGKPLGFYINKNRKGFEWFWITYNWSKAGFSSKDYRAVLRNHKLENRKYKVDPLLREVQYNNFSLTEDYLNYTIDHINSKEIKFLHAYPSAAYTVANYLKREKKQTTLKTFLCGSENVFKFQKELIQDVLNIRMYTWYGLSEKVILAAENETCENYHSNPFYSYTEIIDESDKPVSSPGAVGELVGTGFINTKMPFIRYRTGDYAEYVGETCPSCGHIGLTFKDVKGRRIGDKIYKLNGSSISTTAFNLHTDIYNYIKGLQYYQDTIGKLVVRIIPEGNFQSNIKERFLFELKSRAGEGLDIEVVEVPALEYSLNNKYQILIQKIKNEQ